MESALFFYEKQYFTQRVFKIILFLITAIFTFASIQQLIFKLPFGNRPMSDMALLASMVFLVIFNLLFFSMKLITTIDSKAISIRFYPFHIYTKRFEWPQLSDVIVREYNPIKEFGGWGLRGFGNRKTMTVSGTWLIEIVFVNNQSLLIGTKKPKEAQIALGKSEFEKK